MARNTPTTLNIQAEDGLTEFLEPMASGLDSRDREMRINNPFMNDMQLVQVVFQYVANQDCFAVDKMEKDVSRLLPPIVSAPCFFVSAILSSVTPDHFVQRFFTPSSGSTRALNNVSPVK